MANDCPDDELSNDVAYSGNGGSTMKSCMCPLIDVFALLGVSKSGFEQRGG